MNTRTATSERTVSMQELTYSAHGPGKSPGAQWIPWYRLMLCHCGVHRGRWVYVAEGACKQLRVCQRCGKADRRTRHVRRWQYNWMGQCDQTKVCARCGERTGRRTKHMWGPTYTADANHDAHRCTRCGESQKWSTNSDD